MIMERKTINGGAKLWSWRAIAEKIITTLADNNLKSINPTNYEDFTYNFGKLGTYNYPMLEWYEDAYELYGSIQETNPKIINLSEYVPYIKEGYMARKCIALERAYDYMWRIFFDPMKNKYFISKLWFKDNGVIAWFDHYGGHEKLEIEVGLINQDINKEFKDLLNSVELRLPIINTKTAQIGHSIHKEYNLLPEYIYLENYEGDHYSFSMLENESLNQIINSYEYNRESEIKIDVQNHNYRYTGRLDNSGNFEYQKTSNL